MEELERINEKLAERKCNLRIVIDRVFNYDLNCYLYDSCIEYFCKRRLKWSIMHRVGKFSNNRKALDAAKVYLHINNYKF